jgi:hypothetical protein
MVNGFALTANIICVCSGETTILGERMEKCLGNCPNVQTLKRIQN